MTASKYDLEALRKKMATKISGRRSDPFEFRAPKVKQGETLKFRFFVLPELSCGDKVHGGVASKDMELFVVRHGVHWVNNRPYGCPRLLNDEECDMCQIGFDYLAEIQKSEEEKRKAVSRQWLSSSVFAANIYFPPIDPNPEDLKGKVMWYNAQKQVCDIWSAAVERNDSGDPNDPEAFGAFFNPYEAYLFQLVVKFDNGYNGYKSSRFMANLGTMPICQLANKEPDEKGIEDILARRHDIFTKIEVPNPSKITQLCRAMLDGDDSGNGIAATTPEDTEEQTGKSEPAEKKAKPKQHDDDDDAVDLTPQKTKASKPKVESKAADDDDDVDLTPQKTKASKSKAESKVDEETVSATAVVNDDDDNSVDDDIASILNDINDVDD